MQQIEDFRDKIVLYVEDEDETRDILATILEKLVTKIYVASNGVDGFEIFKKYKDEINLIITDLHLPFLSGQEMIEEIKKVDENNIPILITTSFLNEIPKSCKACSVLKKPFSRKTLFQAMSECILLSVK